MNYVDTGNLSGWLEPLLALLVFLAAHVLPAQPAVRGRLVMILGQRAYLVVFSVVSLLLLAWLVSTVWRAPTVILWYFAPWQPWVPLLSMPVVCVLATVSLGVPNPLSFGGARDAGFKPRSPGVAGFCRHPLLLALAIWAFAHLVPNGELATVLLFGALGVFALVGMRVLDRRRQRAWGFEHWQALAVATSNVPLLALLRGDWQPRWADFPLLRLLAGFLLYALLLWLHPHLFGVPALALS